MAGGGGWRLRRRGVGWVIGWLAVWSTEGLRRWSYGLLDGLDVWLSGWSAGHLDGLLCCCSRCHRLLLVAGLLAG